MGVYVSTSCLKNGSNIIDVLEAYKKTGLKKVELGPSHKYCANLQNKLRQYDFNFIVHHYFPPPKEPFILNLASQNVTILKKSREQVKKSIEFCNSSNIRLFTFHAGYRVDPTIKLNFKNRPIAPYKKAFSTFVESVKEINEFAEDNGVRIAVENNVLSDYNVVKGRNLFLLLCEYAEFLDLFEKIPSDNLGLLLDVGHLQVTSHWLKFDKSEFVNKLKSKVFLIHVHENNSKVDEHRGLNKNSWCLKVIGKKVFRKVPVSLESMNLSVKEIMWNKKLLEDVLKA